MFKRTRLQIEKALNDNPKYSYKYDKDWRTMNIYSTHNGEIVKSICEEDVVEILMLISGHTCGIYAKDDVPYIVVYF